MKRLVFLCRGFAVLLAGLIVSGVLVAPAVAAETENLAYMPAREQIKRFKAGTLSPVDVLQAQIARVYQYNGELNTTGEPIWKYLEHNGKVNGITYEHFDEAMKMAKESEKRYRNGTARPLEGITVAVKDEHAVKGWRVTYGSADFANALPCPDDAPIIEKLRAAGAVLHMQTTIPEYFLNFSTFTKMWGVTRNPWNMDFSTGASSGGSGAVLAAGFTTLATGTDIGGSIRFPSAMNGLYGFKPPLGRVATSEIPYETSGPMARTFDDMVLMQGVIAGSHPDVQTSLRPAMVYPSTYGSLKGVKVAVDYFDDWIPGGVDAEARKALSDAVEVLRQQGAIVEEVKLGWTYENTYQPYVDLMTVTLGDDLKLLKWRIDGTPYTFEALKMIRPVETARAMKAGQELSAKLHGDMQKKVFGTGAIALLMPTVATPYYPVLTGPNDKVLASGNRAVTGFEQMLTYPWNLMNRYPVVSVPVGIAKNNVPLGMQVVGNTYDDLAAFRVAAAYSQAGLKLYSGTNYPDFRNMK